MPNFPAADSAHSTWVPLSTVPLPQYGNRTVWQPDGLCILNYRGSVIAADRDAPPGLQVRFGPGDRWIPLGPGEVLWAPRAYSELHVRIDRRGLGAPTALGAGAYLTARGATGAALDGRATSMAQLLGGLGFHLYNAPIQAFAGPRSSFPGGLMLLGADFSQVAGTNANFLLLGNWFSAADLNAAEWLAVELNFRPSDIFAVNLYNAAAADFAPYMEITLRDPYSPSATWLVGGTEARTTYALSAPGYLRARVVFKGPFAVWQTIQFLDIFNAGLPATRLSAAQAGSALYSSVRLGSGEAPKRFTKVEMGPTTIPVPGTSNFIVTVRNQLAMYDATAVPQAHLGTLMRASSMFLNGTVVGAPQGHCYVDPVTNLTFRLQYQVALSSAAPVRAVSEIDCHYGVAAARVSGGGTSWDPTVHSPTGPIVLAVEEHTR